MRGDILIFASEMSCVSGHTSYPHACRGRCVSATTSWKLKSVDLSTPCALNGQCFDILQASCI